MTQPLLALLGAGPLIGLAVARRFVREGFRIALVGMDGAFLEHASNALPGSRAYACDLGESGTAASLFAQIKKDMGDPAVLVYNASAGQRGVPSFLDPLALERDLRVNAVAALEATQEVLPAMRASGQGTLLFTGGGLALKPQMDFASGSMGKAALRQLALCLADELAPACIHAATITICGFVHPGGPFDPKRIAEVFWELHCEPREAWRREVVIQS